MVSVFLHSQPHVASSEAQCCSSDIGTVEKQSYSMLQALGTRFYCLYRQNLWIKIAELVFPAQTKEASLLHGHSNGLRVSRDDRIVMQGVLGIYRASAVGAAVSLPLMLQLLYFETAISLGLQHQVIVQTLRFQSGENRQQMGRDGFNPHTVPCHTPEVPVCSSKAGTNTSVATSPTARLFGHCLWEIWCLAKELRCLIWISIYSGKGSVLESWQGMQ